MATFVSEHEAGKLVEEDPEKAKHELALAFDDWSKLETLIYAHDIAPQVETRLPVDLRRFADQVYAYVYLQDERLKSLRGELNACRENSGTFKQIRNLKKDRDELNTANTQLRKDFARLQRKNEELNERLREWEELYERSLKRGH